MKPRKQRKIERDLKRGEKLLGQLIDISLESEKRSAGDIREQEKYLRELRAEPCFEDTFEGKVKKVEKIAFTKIGAIMEELSSVTGKNYLLQEALTEIFRDEGDD